MTLPREWYREFFRGIALDVWRQGVPAEQTRGELAFLERTLRVGPGARVLDVPCGSGRHAVPLAQQGLRVTGVDVSSEHLEQGRERAAAAGVAVEWREAEMRDLPWAAEFDAGVCLGNSFGYLDREGTRAFLGAVGRALKPGARFVLDSAMTAESILPNVQDRQEAPVGDILFIEENVYHAKESCLETRYTFVRDGRSETRTGLHWIYTAGEVVHFVEEAGFAVDALHGSFQGTPFVLGGPFAVLAATRR